MPDTSSDHELVIRPTAGWTQLSVVDVWRYRDLLYLLVHRDFVSKYKQTVLGPAWFVLQPLLMTAVFTVIFGHVAKIPTDGLPPNLFYLTGLLAWNYFGQIFQTTSNVFVANASVFGKVYFPRLVVPLAGVVSSLIAFSLQLATLLCVWGYYKLFTSAGHSFGMTSAVALLPLLLLLVAALALGVGLWLSALTAKYRDLSFLNSLILQIWMYGTPVIYSLTRVPEQWRWLAAFNPMVAPVESMKYMFLGRGTVSAVHLAASVAITVVILVSGMSIFMKVEKTFIDTV